MEGTPYSEVRVTRCIWNIANSILRTLLFVAGYTWMLVIPSSKLGQHTYIDENALQPGQVCTMSVDSFVFLVDSDRLQRIGRGRTSTAPTSILRSSKLYVTVMHQVWSEVILSSVPLVYLH